MLRSLLGVKVHTRSWESANPADIKLESSQISTDVTLTKTIGKVENEINKY